MAAVSLEKSAGRKKSAATVDDQDRSRYFSRIIHAMSRKIMYKYSGRPEMFATTSV
jgi:hypothetical protein